MNAKLLNAATNVAIELAKLVVEHEREFKEDRAAVVEESWRTVRESFLKQMPAAEQKRLRLDLDELYDNTKVHARTAVRS